MSRSFKHKPFQAICGGDSAKRDKTLAHRGERRAFSLALARELKEGDFEDFLAPHRLECSWNNTYDWGRDGKQTYQELDDRDWQRYLESTGDGYFSQWPPEWYVQMMRK